jgi:protein KTI12
LVLDLPIQWRYAQMTARFLYSLLQSPELARFFMENCVSPHLITLSEIKRFKRSFVAVHKKAMTIGTVEKGHVDLSMANKFAEYLEENLGP